MKKKEDLLDAPAISLKLNKKDFQRLNKLAEKLSIAHSTLARLYVVQMINEQEGKKK